MVTIEPPSGAKKPEKNDRQTTDPIFFTAAGPKFPEKNDRRTTDAFLLILGGSIVTKKRTTLNGPRKTYKKTNFPRAWAQTHDPD